jgi:serine/threonine protein kinase
MNLLPVLNKRYELQAVAGSGGMGVVYRAVDAASGSTVAIKVMRTEDPDAAARFLREAELLAGMNHPRIVRHVDHGHTPGGEPYLVMEWLSGEDLRDRLNRGRLDADQTAQLGADIADALAYAHAQSVIHRDLKPANVYLCGGDLQSLRLLDFGIARIQQDRDDATRTGTVLGTPAYMAPEQARSERTLDARADLFSLGCVLYECLTGRAPFVAGSAMAVLIKVLLEEPPPLADLRQDVPVALARLVGQLLAKDPSERPASAQITAAALRDMAAESRQSEPKVATAGLTRQERRIVTLMVASADGLEDSDDATRREEEDDTATVRFDTMTMAPTVQLHAGSKLSQLQRRMAAIGLRLHRLMDGTLLATAAGAATAAEQAALTAHGALLLSQLHPSATAVIATGYGLASSDATAEVAIGQAIELAAQALAGRKAATDAPLLLDDATVGLLGGRFEVERTNRATGAFAWRLLGARTLQNQAALLLGRPSPCVGRGRELAILRALLQVCAEEGGTKVLLTGDPGYGKSRLLEEFVAQVRRDWPQVQVWQLRSEAIDQDSPYAGLAALLTQAADLQAGMSDAEKTLRTRARIDRSATPAQRQLIMDLARVTLGIDLANGSERLRAAREDAVLMADLVREGFGAWMHAESKVGPQVVLVDDLQWIDAPSLAAMRLVHEAVSEEPVLFIGAARPEIFERFPYLQTTSRLLQVRLGPLSRRACGQLVRAALRDLATDEVVARLSQLSAGEAYYLEELIRAVAVGQDAVPTTVLAMAQVRIDAIDADSRRVLRAAAVFGMRVWAEGAAALAGGRVTAQLQALVEAEILLPVPRSSLQGHQEFSFRQASLREAAYATLTEADRSLGHRLAAAWLQQVGGADPVALANHFDLGGQAERAQFFYSIAAENALAAHDHPAARRWMQKGLALGVSGEGKARLLLAQAELAMSAGHAYDALQTAEAAAQGFQPGSRLWYRAMTEMGRALARSGQAARLPALVHALMEAPAEPDAAEAAVYAAARIAVNVLFLDLLSLGEQLIAFADRLQATARPPVGLAAQARLEGARSSRLALAGDLAGAAAATRAAMQGFAQLGDRRNASAQQMDLGVLLLRSGLAAEAEPLIAASTEECDLLDIPAAASVGRTWLGLTRFTLGRADEALVLLERAVHELSQQSTSLPHCWCLHALATVHLARNDLAAAEQAALKLQQANRTVPSMWAQSLGIFAQIRLAQGRQDESLHLARDAVRVWQEGLPCDERGVQPLLALAQVLADQGKITLSRRAAADGVELLLRMAAHLDDEGTRHAFLYGMQQHRELITLANPS